jgi:phenylalanyl-tRNA synthetase beta chain
MKLHASVLQKLIELPTTNSEEIRKLFDDVGLEVKDVTEENGQAVFTIETLANRGDTLAALGMARELSARLLTSLKLPQIASELSDRKPSLMVSNITDKCLRYAIMEMSLPSPMRLHSNVAQVMGAADDRHAIVHLLNYIWLEIGQPMHAFDREKIDGEIVVDLTKEAATIEALDGKSYQVPPNSIVIRDKKKIVAVAGVIGCKNSMVTPGTTRVLIEAATFDPISIRKTARAMGLSTDASYTFERGSDIDSVLFGLKRLAYLAAGSAGVVKDNDSAHVLGLAYLEGLPAEKRKIPITLSHLRKQLNQGRLSETEVSSRFKFLGFTVEARAAGKDFEYSLTVPSWRLWDLRTTEDLVEEFARAQGYQKVGLKLPDLDYELAEPNEWEKLLARVEPALLGQGFFEVISRGFYSAEDVTLLGKLDESTPAKHLSLKNSVESSYSHLKITNIIHLARLAEWNIRRGVHSVKMYEFGRLFSLNPETDGPYEHERDALTLVVAGRWYDHEWQKPESTAELLSLFKGSLESMFRALGNEVSVAPSRVPFLHPGMQAALRVGRNECGWFGVVHPLLKEALDLRQDILYAQFDAGALVRSIREREFCQPSDYPAIKRDITLKVADRTFATSVSRIIEGLKKDNLIEIAVTDYFKKSEEKFSRITFRLTFQSKERTLQHDEVDAAMADVLAHLEAKHGIALAG